MQYSEVVINRHRAEVLRGKILEICKTRTTFNDLAKILDLSKGKVKTATDFLTKGNHLIAEKVYDRQNRKWNMTFLTSKFAYRVLSIDELQNQYDMANSAPEKMGKYDAIIRKNKNLQVYKLLDRAKPNREGVRKSQKFVGIGSCFAMFDGF